MEKKITIIGAGLAGSEAALQLADKGWLVSLYEMRPNKMTPAHNTGLCGELVCSNSLKSNRLDTGAGLLKAELELLGCKLLPIASANSVAAGQALAVDRTAFAQAVTLAIQSHPQITLINEEVTSIPNELCILATGPLTSDALIADLQAKLGNSQLYFFDAIAPIVSADSINYKVVYSKDRYDKGDPDYLNCPFDKDEYIAFCEALLTGEKHVAHEFENEYFSSIDFKFYENCMPIEELAHRGIDTLRHGVMRPMGLELPSTGKKAYAVLQLRAENSDRSAFNLVGCQTMLRYPEQQRIFRMIPGLQQAEFLRYGSIHRNSYLNAPELLTEDLTLKGFPQVYVAGQFCGVEGYVESIASGLIVSRIISDGYTLLPQETILGQFWRRLLTAEDKKQFQPMNANFGLLPEPIALIRDKKLKRMALAERSLTALKAWLANRNNK